MLSIRVAAYVNSVRLVQLRTLQHVVRIVVRDGAGPSLLWQLRASVENNGGSGDKGNGTKSRLLISADAFDLYNALELEWASRDCTLEDGFARAYHLMLALNSTLTEWVEFSRSVEDVVNQIDNLLNPGRRFVLTEPCPTCDNTMASVVDSSGELVQRHALVLDTAKGCLCLACGAHWPVEELENLAREIGCAPLPVC